MTQCIGSPAQEAAAQYLAGELPEAEAEQFENHFFGCEPCHEQLRALMDVRDALAAGHSSSPAASGSTPEPRQAMPRRRFSARILAFPVPVAVMGSLAAMLLTVAVLVGLQRSSRIASATHLASSGTNALAHPQQPAPAMSQVETQPAPTTAKSGSKQPPTESAEPESTEPAATELALLADVHLPGYQAPQLRDGEPADADHTAFTTGMQAYAQGDCGSALDALTKVTASAKDAVAANLYSGLCRLKARQLDRAETSFAAVYAAGDTPALETAEFFMAQAMLLHGDAAGAKSWLNRTVALHGDYEERAQKQIAALAK